MADTTLAEGFFQRHRAKIKFAGPDECWLWTAYKDGWGYGTVKARGKKRKAHREAYEAEHGVGSADGVMVRHRCDTPACVNPDHLEVGTHAENMRDMDERGRRVIGEAHGCAKLTEDEVRTIRTIHVPRHRDLGQKALARRFGVAPTQISKIVNRERWAHVA